LGRHDASLTTLRLELERHHEEAPFDALILETCYAGLVTGIMPIATVVDEHNIESVALETWCASRDDLSEARVKQIAAQRAFERRLWGRADAVTCVSPNDADHVRRERPEASVHVIPNGAPTHAIPFRVPSLRTGDEILFVGSMNWQPNETAACFLAEEVLPLVKKRVPLARLVICGMGPSPRLLALRSDDVEVTGTVPSVEPYLERAAVAAIALRHGAGTSLKAVEALASGLPLVSTAIGVRGLPVTPDEHYLAAETAAEIAAQICRVLVERSAFDELARRARVVAEQFDWATIGANFSRLVTETIRRHSV
jgi:glycosyltransferase involved in cell wall biosynthesis